MISILVLPAALSVTGSVGVLGWWPRTRAAAGGVTGAVAAVSLAVTAFAEGFTGAQPGELGTVEALGLLALIVVTVRDAPARQAVVAGTLAHLAVTVCVLRSLGDHSVGNAVGGCVFWSLTATIALIGGLYLRMLDARRLRSVGEARREQRLDLARDLHDFVAHDVSEILVQAQAGRFAGERDPAAALEALRRIEEAGLRAMASMDRTVHMLHADDQPSHAPVPDLADLPDLAARFTAAGGARVRLAVDADLVGAVAREAGSTAYRIVVEALTNVRRHAPRAESVDVGLARVDGSKQAMFEVSVVNSSGAGHGFRAPATPPRRGGLGLAGLQDRVESLGGTMTIGPRDEGGWRVSAFMPLDSGAAPGGRAQTRARVS